MQSAAPIIATSTKKQKKTNYYATKAATKPAFADTFEFAATKRKTAKLHSDHVLLVHLRVCKIERSATSNVAVQVTGMLQWAAAAHSPNCHTLCIRVLLHPALRDISKYFVADFFSAIFENN